MKSLIVGIVLQLLSVVLFGPLAGERLFEWIYPFPGFELSQTLPLEFYQENLEVDLRVIKSWEHRCDNWRWAGVVVGPIAFAITYWPLRRRWMATRKLHGEADRRPDTRVCGNDSGPEGHNPIRFYDQGEHKGNDRRDKEPSFTLEICGNCGVRVVRKSDGTCPACRHQLETRYAN